ncbi:MAG: adenosylmethionine decarboxylase [bacterium]
MKALGRHLLVEYSGCDHATLKEVPRIQALMEEAARVSGATIVQTCFHQFNPYGVSGVVVIAESHLAIHTWPEHGYASVDIYTCGDSVDPWKAHAFLQQALGASDIETNELFRGQLGDEPASAKYGKSALPIVLHA